MTIDIFQEKVMAAAKAAGLTEYELYYMSEDSESVSSMGNATGEVEIDEFSSDVEAGATFRCIVDGHVGYASTELLSEEEAYRIVAKAVENAKTLESDDEAIIYAGSASYPEIQESIPAEADLKEVALTLTREAMKADSRVQGSSQGRAAMASGTRVLVNSAGLNLSSHYTQQVAMIGAVIREGEEQYNSHEFKNKPFAELNLTEMAEKAVAKAIDQIQGAPVASGKYTVVYDTDAFGSLLAAFSSVFSAKKAQQGMSLLAGKEGDSIGVETLTIVDDPLMTENAVAFDGEGVATYTKNVVENGVFKTLLYNLETAKKAGVDSTGNASRASYASPVEIAPTNFYVKPGAASKEELYEKVGEGLLITELSGLHAGLNAITGDYSLMAAGYKIEGGKKTTYVNGITVSGNFYDLLKSIDTIGNDLEFGFPRGGTRFGAPSILVKDVPVAGK